MRKKLIPDPFNWVVCYTCVLLLVCCGNWLHTRRKWALLLPLFIKCNDFV